MSKRTLEGFGFKITAKQSKGNDDRPTSAPVSSEQPIVVPEIAKQGESDTNIHSATASTSQEKLTPQNSDADNLKLINDCFPGDHDKTKLNSYITCVGKCSSTKETTKKTSADKFNHQWLFNKNLTLCSTTGIWWLIYIEEQGMYCALCRKHGSQNLFNKSKTYSEAAVVRFKKAAVSDHATSAQHKAAVVSELSQRTSIFHKDFVTSKRVRSQVYSKVFMSVYWLAKQGMPIRNALPLIQLIEQIGNTDMKFFSHRSAGSVRKIVLTLGEVILNKILEKVNRFGKFGLLEVTDISTTEQVIAFIQYITDTGLTETPFLYVADCLADSGSANSVTLLKVITDNLSRLELSTDNISGFVSDGASVMVGVKEGVATKLKRINPQIISVHRIAHRLALACTDTNADIAYIKQVEDILRQLWQFMENSPKRTAAFVKVQEELQRIHLVSVKGRKKVAHKLKKACSTRWLSFDASVQSSYHSIEAVIQTLNILDKDVVATGLMTKIRNIRFLSAVYIMKDTLPIIAQLSKEFQWGSVNFSHIAPIIQSNLPSSLRQKILSQNSRKIFIQMAD